MRKVLLSALCVAAAVWAGTPWKITPGASVGNITLGMDSVVVAKSLGVKEAHALTSGLMFIDAKDKAGLIVQYEKAAGKIVMVTVLKPSGTIGGQPVDYAADGGLTIGATIPQMEAAYGKDYEARELKTGKGQPQEMYYAYKHRGVGFQFKGGMLSEISVWAKH